MKKIELIDWKKISAAQQAKTYNDAMQSIMEIAIAKINEIVEDYNARRTN